MTQQLDEPLDARIPESFVVAKPVVRALERPWVDAAIVNASAHGALHKAGSLERLNVLRRRSKRHPVWCRELAYGVLTSGEPLEHRPSRVVTESAEDKIEAF